MNKRESLIGIFNSMDDSDIVSAWNEWAYEHSGDDIVEINDEDFINMLYQTPMEALRAASYGDYHYSHEYVKLNAYGNLVSTDYPVGDWFTIEELVDNIIFSEEEPVNFNDTWIEDLIADFQEWYKETYGKDAPEDDEFDYDNYNFVTDTWESIAEDINNIEED